MSKIEELNKSNTVSMDDYINILAKEQILAIAYCTLDLDIRFKAGSLINQLFRKDEDETDTGCLGFRLQKLYEDDYFTWEELMCRAYDVDNKAASKYRNIFREYFTFKSVEDIIYLYSKSIREGWDYPSLANAICAILPPDVSVIYSNKFYISAGELKIELKLKSKGEINE